MSDTVPSVAHRDAATRSWVRAWPLNKPALLVLGWGTALLLTVTTVVGLLYMYLLDDGPVGDADRGIAEWLADHRTPTINDLTEIGTSFSDTLVKVILVAVVGGAMVLIWRRWHDGVFLALALIVEATVFVVSSFVVDRDRPPVVTLDEPAPSGSFPSGHAAAAVAFYGGLFMVVCWHTRRRWIRALFLAVAIVVPLIVGFSRVQRGMHHPIDVVAGFALGIAALLLVRAVLARGVAELGEHLDEHLDEDVQGGRS